ncbi:MAG: hypothetical protein ACPGVT_08665 [Maricaulaceae bacterium]
MRFFLTLSSIAVLSLAGFSVSAAQDISVDELMGQIILPETMEAESAKDDADSLKDKVDYSQMTETEERTARLDGLFLRIKAEDNEEDAKLIAEEIMAIWIDSGSATVNLLLRRGAKAEQRGEIKHARRLYDHVTTLTPEYAEGWARSARLAFREKDYNRALSESTQTLLIEPRQFYALVTLGSVLETLGKTDEAYEAYLEVQKLYPEMKGVKARVETLGEKVDGDFL